MTIAWSFLSYEALSKKQLHDAFKLRQAVFVVEQDCPYQDADEKDEQSFHLLGYDAQGDLVAYLRLVKAGVSYEEVSFGRIVTSEKVRGKGVGRQMMEVGLEEVHQLFGEVAIRISAQSHLIPFYKDYGFQVVGEEYLEDDIPHTEMLRSA
jgi:ElaA protein